MSPVQLHERLLAASNRLLELPEAEREVLGYLLGALINVLAPGSKSPTKDEIVALLERTADRLGAPGAPLRVRRPR